MDATGASSSQSPSKPAPPVVCLTQELIAHARSSSQDDGQTLDLSHCNLTEVTDANAGDLALAATDPSTGESNVLRVALGYNRLEALPKGFTALTRIRYLNLRSNLFSVFPAVLTTIPSLEVLDISRNRIRRLPHEPGTLRNLRVFSISRNRFTKLPHYLTGFQHLSVLKVSHNPIQWPDGLKDEPDDVDDSEAMQRWISRVKAWLDESSGGAPPRAAENGDTSSMHDSSRGEYDFITHEGDLVSDEDAVALARNALSTATPHARSFSIDSVSTTMSGTSDMTSPTDVDESLAFISPFPSPSHATTPDLSLSAPDQPLAFDSSHVPASQHARNASYSVAGPSKSIGASLMANKSLPDLRLGNLGFAESSAQRKARRPPRLPDLPIVSPAHSHVSPSGFSPGFMGSGGRLRSATHAGTPSSAGNLSHAGDVQMSSVDPERNAYFRRFSVQRPPPGDRSAPSSPLLMVVDAARGIYFALSQVHDALRQFSLSNANEGLSGVLSKVLTPARKFLSQLLDALDRFDEQSKLPGPPAAAGRSVMQACKDSVSVFHKVVGVLHVQLSLAMASHDPRYTRWLLLILHGSMAEVAVSWQVISEHGDAVQPLLKGQRSTSKAHAPSRSLVSPITKQGESSTSSPTNPSGWVRGTRRHAGSFSYKDVQLGRALPSMDAPPGTPPPLRRGGPSIDNGPVPPANGLMTPSAASEISSHTRDDSISSTFSQGFSSANGQSTPQPSSQQPSRQHLAASAVDQDFFTTMDDTIEIASGVWSHLAEIIGDLPDSRSSFEPTLQNAQDVTRKLRDDLERIQMGSTPAIRKTTWENANAFLKAVVQVVTEVKGLSEGQQVIPLAVRKAIARLGQLTQEFAMFLQISSLAPSPTAPSSDEHHRSPQHQQQASLGRSRSARTSSSEKLPIARKDVPMSAQPQQQAFKISPSPFTRSNGRRNDEDG